MTDFWILASDDRPGVPGAPVDMTVDSTNHLVFTLIIAVPTIIAVGLAVRAMIRDGNFLWPVLLLGGVIGILVEPILDYMGGVWWPKEGDLEAFTALGVNIPWLVVLVYPWILGWEAYYSYRLFSQGATVRQLWRLVALCALIDIAIETIGIRGLNAYAYFGTQPLNPWGLPLWYVPCNALGAIVAGALVYALRRRLTGIRVLMALPLMPMSFAGVYAAIGWPCWVSLNSDWPQAVAHLCGLATFAMGYLVVTMLADNLCVPESESSSNDLAAAGTKVSVR